MEDSTTYFDYSDSPYPIRAGLVEVHKDYWQTLAKAGSWFNGVQRIAIAEEVRNALQCPFCAQRKTALSPYALQGEHLQSDALGDDVVDAVHRIVTDQSRITKNYVQSNVQKGFSEEQYVELVGIVVNVLSIDEFHRALGLPQESLPLPVAGEPDHYRPAHTERDTAYVAMIPPEGAVGPESDLWPERTANVLRALSLVPDAVRSWMKIANEHYLSMEAMGNFTGPNGRSINRMQIELVAGRVSSINECFY